MFASQVPVIDHEWKNKILFDSGQIWSTIAGDLLESSEEVVAANKPDNTTKNKIMSVTFMLGAQFYGYLCSLWYLDVDQWKNCSVSSSRSSIRHSNHILLENYGPTAQLKFQNFPKFEGTIQENWNNFTVLRRDRTPSHTLRAILYWHGFWLILAEFGNADFHRTSSLPGFILTDFTVFRSTPNQKTKFATEKWNSPNSISRLNSMTCFGLSKFSGIQLNFSTEFGWIPPNSYDFGKKRQYRMALKGRVPKGMSGVG
jgi:hypothetical protein